MRLALELKCYPVQLLNSEIHLASLHPAHVASIYPAGVR